MSEPRGLIASHSTIAVFSTSLIAIVGGGILALPMALVAFGPLAAGLVVLLMGLINIFTIGALATAIARSSAVVRGRGRITSLTSEHLGGPAAVVASVAGTVTPAFALISYVLGVVTTLPSMLFGSALQWLLALGAIVVAISAFQARELFVSSATVVAVVNLLLLAGMLAMLVVNADPALLTRGPQIGMAGGWDQALALVFGAVLFSFFGHTPLFIVARPALQSDPSGQALRRGAMTAMAAATVVNTTWVVACLSTVPASEYLAENSTGIGLLADAIGPQMTVMGLAFLILAPGLAAVSAALELTNAVDERLPRLRSLSAVLTPGWSAEVSDPRTDAVVMLGQIDDQLIATAHRGRSRVQETITGPKWDGESLLRQIGLSRGAWVRLTMSRQADETRVNVQSSLPIAELLPRKPHHDFLDTDEDSQRVLRLCMREPARLEVLAERLGWAPDRVAAPVDQLVADGKLVALDNGTYRAVLGSRHAVRSPLVSGLLAQLSQEEEPPEHAVPGLLNTPAGRRAIVTLPVLLCIIAVAILEQSGARFASVISLTSMATIVLLAGGFPLLLNLSLRRRAEVPVRAGRLIQSLTVSWALFASFAGVCLLYAVVIYEAWFDRLVAAAVFVVFVLLFVTARQRQAFAPRRAMHLEMSRDGQISAFAIDQSTPLPIDAPKDVALHDRQLVITIPHGGSSTLLLTATDGETVPTRLGRYVITSGNSQRAVGRLVDTLGDEVQVGPGEIHVTWTLI